MLIRKLLGLKSKKTQEAPRYNANGTRAITMEDYKNGNFISVGDIILSQQIAAARMQQSNQIFSGFQGFLGGANASSYGSSQTAPYGSIQYNNQVLNGMFSYYSASLRQLQTQTAMQMSHFTMASYGFGY